MTVKPTTTDPGTDWEPGDFHFGFRHAMSLEEAEEVFRCTSGDYMWGQKQADNLNWVCSQLADTLNSNLAATFDRDVRTGHNRDAWRDLRERWGYTVAAAADEIGVDTSTLSRWETGVRRPAPAYKRFLEKLWGQDVAYWRTHIFLESMIRDAWPPDEWQSRKGITDAWNRLFEPDGHYDTWRATGILPDTNIWGEKFTGILELRAEQHAKAKVPIAA